jgi:hypothetical protein
MRAAVLLIVLWATAADARILDFHSDIRVAKSGELTVTERITLVAEKGRAGLSRELPPDSRVTDLIRNGHPEPYVLNGVQLRTGGTALVDGRHTYQITYRAARRVAFLADHDALHWSLKGAERITAEVVLPASVPARQIKVEGSGGEWQSFVRDGRAAFRGRDGIAIVVRFPKGVVADPGVGQRAQWFFSDYFGGVLVLLLLALTAWVLLKARALSRSRGY